MADNAATDIAALISDWDRDEGKPYKGKLIDWDAYDGEAEPPLSCMCAQGQVLNRIGGWSPNRLHDAYQAEADRETAKLLGISRAHAVLLRTVNDSAEGAPSIVLTDPTRVLGDQAEGVLAFWRYLDRMDKKRWAAARAAARAAGDAAGAAAWASNEIQGARILREQGRPFFFLPLFGFADPEAVMEADRG